MTPLKTSAKATSYKQLQKKSEKLIRTLAALRLHCRRTVTGVWQPDVAFFQHADPEFGDLAAHPGLPRLSQLSGVCPNTRGEPSAHFLAYPNRLPGSPQDLSVRHLQASGTWVAATLEPVADGTGWYAAGLRLQGYVPLGLT